LSFPTHNAAARFCLQESFCKPSESVDQTREVQVNAPAPRNPDNMVTGIRVSACASIL
jgi:hypothetical protein